MHLGPRASGACPSNKRQMNRFLMSTENAAQGQTTVEEEESIMKNLQLDGSDSNASYHSPKDKLSHLLEKRGAQKGSDDRDPDY
jgi:hypothetical protein